MALYSLADIAKEINVAASTLRYQAQQYQEFLPMRKVEGERWPKYEEEALPILRTIMEMTAAGKTREDVKDALFSQSGTVYHQETQVAVKGQPSEQQPIQPRVDLGLMELLHQQQEIISMKNEVINELRGRVKELQAELITTKAKLRADNVFRRFGL